MYYCKERLQKERPAKVLATSAGEGSHAASTTGQKISLVVSGDIEMTRKVAPVAEGAGKSHDVDSHHCPSEIDMIPFKLPERCGTLV